MTCPRSTSMMAHAENCTRAGIRNGKAIRPRISFICINIDPLNHFAEVTTRSCITVTKNLNLLASIGTDRRRY